MDQTESIRITILGARGSIPTDGADTAVFGGATSCVLYEAGDRAIFLDAGTGIMDAPDLKGRQISVLLSHPHIDHLLGLPFFTPLYDPKQNISIYGMRYDGLSVGEQIARFLCPPLWPVGIGDFPGAVHPTEFHGPLMLGDVKAEAILGSHPGGAAIYKLTRGDKSIVYATDYEHTPESDARLAEFAKGAKILFYDAQYTDEEYETHRGFGHSTASDGYRLREACGAEELIFIHHDPYHTDEVMLKLDEEARKHGAHFARAKEGITL